MREIDSPGSTHQKRQAESPIEDEFRLSPQVLNLICGIGTNENMALAVAFLSKPENGGKAKIGKLRNEFNTAQGPEPVSVGSKIIIPDKIKTYLTASRMVETVPRNGISDYESDIILTELGSSLGLAFAGHILDFSLHHKVSLHDLFGSIYGVYNTDDPGKINPNSAPVTRLIFYHTLLNSDGPVSPSRLISITGRHRSKGTLHLNLLKNSNIVEYDSHPRGDSLVKYRLSHRYLDRPSLDDEDARPQYRSLSKNIYKILFENEFQGDADWLDAKKTTEILVSKYPYYASQNRKFLTEKIRLVYTHFVETDIAERIGITSDARALVSLTDTQRDMLSDLLTITGGFEDPSATFLEEGKRKALEIVRDPERVRILVEKAQRKKAA